MAASTPASKPNTAAVTAAFSLVMLAATHAEDVYTFAQYEKMFGNTGFSQTSLHPVPNLPQQVLVSVKQEHA